MRIVERGLYRIGGLLALILLFIAFCHYNPGVAEKIGAMIQSEKDGDAASGTTDTFVVNATVTRGVIPTAASSAGMSGSAATPDVGTEYSAVALSANAENSARVSDSNAETTASDADNSNANERSAMRIPAKVAGLSGYIPIRATGTEVTQEKADEILSTLSPGNTGEDLTFDGEMYPYYYIINDTQKAIYKQIYANADDLNKQFSPVENITAGDLKDAYTAVVNDHPELFWVETAYKYKYAPTGQVADITLAFNITANNLEESKSKFNAAAKEVTDSVYGLYTDYEKEKKAHDELISRVKYDANAPMNQSAYSALVYGRTVCAGYSRALQYVLQQLNVPCYYVTGYAGENHAWNIVKLDDGYYNVDSTWDDTNPNTYDYFNCSDSDYEDTHARRDLAVYLPECNGNRYSGLEVNPPADTVITGTETTPGTSTTTTPSTPPANTTTTPNTTTTDSAAQQSNIQSITVQTVRSDGDMDYIGNIEDYYVECFEAMMARDSSSISFDVIVVDKDLWDDIYDEYLDGRCQDGYIERYLVEKHKNSCSVRVEAHPRNDGSYLLRHYATVN